MEEKNLEFGAKEILTGEEVQGIIVLVVIFLLGYFSIFASAWWLKFIGWVVMGLTALSAYHIGVGIKKRRKDKNENKEGETTSQTKE